MQMPKLEQVKHICQMPVFSDGCRESLGSGLATSGLPYRGLHFWCSEPQHGCLKPSSPDKWMLSTFISFILVCLSLQWGKHHAFALKCGCKRKSLINVCCREHSEAAAYNSSPPPHMLRED